MAGESVSNADVDYRLKVEQAYGNTVASMGAVTVSLINDAIERELARQVGVAPTAEEITALVQHTDTTSQAPELLKQVKSIFGEDKAGYERLFLEPRITNRKLRYYQSLAPQLHREERALIEKVQAGVQRGSPLQQAAKEAGLEAATAGIEDKPIELPDAVKRLLKPDEPLPKDPLIPLLEKLRVGEVFPDIIEDDNSYRVIRLVEKDGQRYRIETVRVDKTPFEAWFRPECAKLDVRIADPQLAENIRVRYPGLCWMPMKN